MKQYISQDLSHLIVVFHRGVQATSTTAPSMLAPHINHGEIEAPSACDSHNRYVSSCWEWEHLRMEQNQCRNLGKY